MPEMDVSLPEGIIAVLAVSLIYGTWLWSRLRAGRREALWAVCGVIIVQIILAFGSRYVVPSLAAAGYHSALVGAAFSLAKVRPRAVQINERP